MSILQLEITEGIIIDYFSTFRNKDSERWHTSLVDFSSNGVLISFKQDFNSCPILKIELSLVYDTTFLFFKKQEVISVVAFDIDMRDERSDHNRMVSVDLPDNTDDAVVRSAIKACIAELRSVYTKKHTSEEDQRAALHKSKLMQWKQSLQN